ncbi:acyltransferase [Parafrankia soli]|uniref:Acyltransferase n=2 Tax=Parafrankia soli TaxID=2599596 RepID=A0A1S1PJT4_9ACTN|nr:acyltransferase [Parafrankia soli]
MRAGSLPMTDGPPGAARRAKPTPRPPAGPAETRQPTDAEATAAAKFAYNPALDGLRVICIYIILAGHMGAIHASNVAVDMFCVLSGFLITTLLLAEQARTGTVSIGRFLVRRAYKLMPVMWVYLLIGLAITVAFKWDDIPYRDDYIKSALSTFLNVNNWYKVENPLGGGRWLAHVWSLSMEEQFYLVWPWVFLLFVRSARLRPYLLTFLIASIGLIMGWTYMMAANGAPRSRVYLAPDTHIAPLLIGCLVAVWRDNRLRALATPVVRDKKDGDRKDGGGKGDGKKAATGAHSAATAAAVERWTSGRRLAALGLPAGIVLFLLAFLGPNKDLPETNWIDYGAYVPSAALGALLIIGADVNRDARWVRLLGSPKMAWTGKITYSIYLWHYPFISAAAGQLVPRIGLWPSVVVAAVCTTITAYFSNRFIEKPIIARRPKWADTPRGPARPAAAAGPAGAPAQVPAKAGPREPRERDLSELPELPELEPVLAGVGTSAADAEQADGRGGRAGAPPRPGDWSDGDVDWVDEGYPGRGGPAGPGPARAGYSHDPDSQPMPAVPRPSGPRAGEVVYDRADGPPVYEHGPAVGATHAGGFEPTPIPDWAAYPALNRGPGSAADAGPAMGAPRQGPAASMGGDTMNLHLPSTFDPGAPPAHGTGPRAGRDRPGRPADPAEPGRLPGVAHPAGHRPGPAPGHAPAYGHSPAHSPAHGQALGHVPGHGHVPGPSHAPAYGHGPGNGHGPAHGHGPAYGRGPGESRGPGRDQGLDRLDGAGHGPADHAGDHVLEPVRDPRAGREPAEPDPLFGPVPGAGRDW